MPKIWQFSVIEFSKETWISGTILYSNKNQKHATKAIKNAKYVLKSYQKKTFANKQIKVVCNSNEFITKTDVHGYFSLLTTHKINKTPVVINCDTLQEITTLQTYPTYFPDTSKRLAIISDIDETILHSHTKSAPKRIYTTLFKPAHKRGVVTFTKELFLAYRAKNPRYYYVSKSEANLFKIISEFLISNDLPKGILLLTPYLNFKKLIKNQKELDFKKNTIEKIITLSPSKEFILVGDDSQKDVEIYTDVAKKFPKQISSIFIRQTKKTVNSEKLKNWQLLKNTGVNAHYFKKKESFNPKLL